MPLLYIVLLSRASLESRIPGRPRHRESTRVDSSREYGTGCNRGVLPLAVCASGVFAASVCLDVFLHTKASCCCCGGGVDQRNTGP